MTSTPWYNGITGIYPMLLPLPWISEMDFSDPTPYYYLLLGICLLASLSSWWIINSPFGRIVAAIQDNESKLEELGYNTSLYKAVIFAISAAFAGMLVHFMPLWLASYLPLCLALSFLRKS